MTVKSNKKQSGQVGHSQEKNENGKNEKKRVRVQFPKDATAHDIYEAIKKIQQDWEKRHNRKVGETAPKEEDQPK